MIRLNRPKTVRKAAGTRFVLAGTGCFLILVSPVIGAIPGPGFIIVFPIGLAMVLRNSRWAKKNYVWFKSRFPDYGNWTDWALRRHKHRTMPKLPRFFDALKRAKGNHRST